jgi:hypothetical protein
MTTYDNTNRGVLFDNDRKETDSHPDMTGSININGVDHWFSGWWKDGSKGEFLSLSIGKPKDQQARQPVQQSAPARRGNRPSAAASAPARAPARQSSGFDDMDDDIPF